MCGIAGVIKVHDPKDGTPPPPLQAIPEAWLDILDESIKHRGPDGQGRFRDRAVRDDGTVVDVALVHRRLSIIDHEGGHQPMVHDGQHLRPDLTYQPGDTPIIASEVGPDKPLVAVVFNGCIYNHRELREELEAKGYVFETDHSDTEVLVHGWRAWGETLRTKLDAMHAHLIWNSEIAELLSGSDEAGEKPLFWDKINNSTHILSQAVRGFHNLHAFIGDADVSPDNEFVSQWITHGTSNTLPAIGDPVSPRGWAHWPHAYDHFGPRPRPLSVPKRGDPDAFTSADDVDRTLRGALADRLDADVPVGLFLSGGIDSSLLAALSAQVSGRSARAFTVRMPDSMHDESEAARDVARHLSINHVILDCDPNPCCDLVKLIETIGLPFGDSSLLPSFWISRAASREVKVAIGGDGGDELFGGYRRHTAAQWADSSSIVSKIIECCHPLLQKLPLGLTPTRSTQSRSSDVLRFLDSYTARGYEDVWSIFPVRLLHQLIETEWDVRSEVFRACPDRLVADFLSYLPYDILRKTDTASMSAPIELRSPFLAKRVIVRAFATPLKTLMPNGQRKGLLKQVARKYLPDHIVDRPKQGFAIPIGEWFRSDYGNMRQLLYDHLHSTDPFPGLAEAGVELNMKFVEQMLREHDAAGERSINPWHGRDHSQRLYMLLVLSIWSKWLQRIRKSESQSA